MGTGAPVEGVPSRTGPATCADGALLVVSTRLRQRPTDDLDGDWSISVNGRPYPGEDRCFPPSLPYQGALVRRLLNGSPAPDEPV